MTRADWYAQKYAGCWRTARKQRKCGQSLCLKKINPGSRYFDTRDQFKILCADCANGHVQ